MLETFSIDTFQPRVGEIFHFVAGDVRLPTKLTEVHRWSDASANGRPRQPFSLIFHTVPDAIVPQGTYVVEHEEMGRFELFLGPIGPDERGMRYEAVFT